MEDIGSGDEIVDVVLEIEDEKVRCQLIRKAIKMGAQFTSDNFMNLDGELPIELYVQLGRYAGFDHNDPYFDEDNMDWDDFYNAFCDWDETLCAKRIQKLTKFGPADEVREAILNMPSSSLEDMLYKKALAAGVKFTHAEKEEMGRWDELIPEILETALTDEKIDKFAAKAEAIVDNYEREQKRQKRIGFWGVIIGLLSGINKSTSKHSHSHRCNGDCDNCPAHYGYRYGRWYYGHGHQRGCERGGNGGATGKTYRD